MHAYNEYKRELSEEQIRRKMQAEEMDDVIGSKPELMDEESVIEVLKGHKFKFSVANYDGYLKESRKICEKIMNVAEFNLNTAINTI